MGGVLGESERHYPVPKADRGNSPLRQSNHNSRISLRRSIAAVIGSDGMMGPRDLQCKDVTVTVTALRGCSGTLLPPSFERVADLGYEMGNWGRDETACAHKTCASVMLQVRVVGLRPYTVSGSLRLWESRTLKFMRKEFLKKKKRTSIRCCLNKWWRLVWFIIVPWMTSKEIDTFQCREDLWDGSEGFIKIRNDGSREPFPRKKTNK